MYVELHNYNELEQKVLYYKLNSIFNLENEDVEKFAGIYAIFKDNVCLYVGQSFNLASRLATHLRGKYQEADYIYIWDIQQFTDSDLQKLKKDKQKHFLDECEKLVMSALKPIENIDIDMDYVSEVEDIDIMDLDPSMLIKIKKPFTLIITNEIDTISELWSFFIALKYKIYFEGAIKNEKELDEIFKDFIFPKIDEIIKEKNKKINNDEDIEKEI